MSYRNQDLSDLHGQKHPYISGMDDSQENKVTLVPGALELTEEECELCGSGMFGLHCKLVCPNCGYRRDCSDP